MQYQVEITGNVNNRPIDTVYAFDTIYEAAKCITDVHESMNEEGFVQGEHYEIELSEI